MRKIIILVIIATFMLGSCNSKPDYFNKEYKMTNQVWKRFDVFWFDVPVRKNDVLDFYLPLSHTKEYPLDKFWVNITFYTPDGTTRSRDYDFDLKDKEGNWLGIQRDGLWKVELPVRKEMPVYEAGICKVRVENKYSKFELPGVASVGLIAKKSTP
ncbi:MAG: gliding motility lipoprotein GldH [Chlorobi bacterium]|nr:gliding motility lipoprotein GldH [Chlorobiota bacterium]